MPEGLPGDFSEVLALCHRQGVALTTPRRIILEVLAAASDLPCAHEIHRRVSSRHSVGLRTIYRTLNGLADAGIIARREFGDGKARYECVHHGPRPHLIDLDNGQIVNGDAAGLAELLQAEAERLGFRLVNYRLQMMVSVLKQECDGEG